MQEGEDYGKIGVPAEQRVNRRVHSWLTANESAADELEVLQMPVILVVDDAETDRALIRELLKQEAMDWIVEFSDSAEHALVRLQELAIDLVITDMMMPGMSGMELLDYVHKQTRPVPVVLISGQGNAALAVEAVKNGAASYVPKDQLGIRLVETVKQVLSVGGSEQSYAGLFANHIEDVRFRFCLNNDPALIPPLVSLLQQTAYDMRLLGNEGRTRLGVALDEAVINAMYHGNLELPSSDLAGVRSQLRDGKSVELIENRRKEEPYSDRFVRVDAFLGAERIEITIRDDGGGFSRFFADDGKDHRGLTLIKNLMDEVAFNDSGNEIRLVKYRESLESSESLALDIDDN